MELGEYLSAARRKPHAWRSHDCTAFPAIWAGFADALPQYSSEAEAEAMLFDAGGLVALWEQAIAAHPGKAHEVSEPQAGDVGVIEMPAPREQADPETGETAIIIDSVEIGAIWTGQRWAFVPLPGGIAAVSAPTVLRVWRPVR